jgi:hypothetical protein
MDITAILVLLGLLVLVTIIAFKQAKERKEISNLPKGGTPTDVEVPAENPSKVPTKRGTPIIK